MAKNILVIDDDKNLQKVLKYQLEEENYLVDLVSSGTEGISNFKQNKYNLIICDLRLGDMQGMEVLEKIKEQNNLIPVIILTAYGTVNSAVAAMKKGAYHYLTKPIDSEELKVIVKKAMEVGELIQENILLKEELTKKFSFEGMIGVSAKMQNVFSLLKKVCDSDATVLITGETGTGKELVAKALHYNSPRKNKSFVVVNCAALPKEILESELFGHKKGSFTGAVADKIGKFEAAEFGTIFLDEIGEMDINLQSKILRVLQQKEVERIGENILRKIDVRIIAATNKNLDEEVEQQKFRQDLFFRLSVVNINLPTLRERKEDISLLIKYFLKKFSAEDVEINKQAKEYLLNYNYPGNVRELENIIESALLTKENNLITLENLPERIFKANKLNQDFTLPDEGISIEALEKSLLLQALQKANNNQTKAAKLLGITRPTLLYRLEKYGIK